MPITLAHLKRLGFTLFVLAAIVAGLVVAGRWWWHQRRR